MLSLVWKLLSYDIGIDLGTVNTLVLVKDKGIMIREPTVVALHKKTRQILAVGTEAKKMLGRTPVMIEAIRPLKNGVISDFDATEAMLRYFIQRVHSAPTNKRWALPKIVHPRIVVGIPSGVTEVERRAVQDACLSAGAREAYLIEEPMAAAIGAKLPIEEPDGMMVVDIGGGTTEIAIISLGGMVINRSLRVAGDELDQDIISYLKMKHGILIGERSAEDVKIEVGSAHEVWSKKEDRGRPKLETVIRGRDLSSGLPKSLKVTEAEIREAMMPTINKIVQGIQEVLESAPPELAKDIVERGIVLAGGGALIRGLDKLVAEETKLPVWIADDPLTTVVRGCGRVLDDNELLKKVQVTGGLRMS